MGSLRIDILEVFLTGLSPVRSIIAFGILDVELTIWITIYCKKILTRKVWGDATRRVSYLRSGIGH